MVKVAKPYNVIGLALPATAARDYFVRARLLVAVRNLATVPFVKVVELCHLVYLR